MLDRLYHYNWSNPNIIYSFDLAFSNLCDKYNIGYTFFDFKKQANALDINTMPASNDNIIVFFFNDYNRNINHFKSLRHKCPNSICIQVGTDSQYNGYGDISLVDFHLDLMEEYVEKSRNDGTPSELLWWTISKQIKDFIKLNDDPLIDMVCLCKDECSYERYVFFRQLKKRYSMITDYKWFHISKLLQIYCNTKFTLGITHSPHNGNKTRGMKGFRDWIGPLCNSLLIYDDHPQMKKYLSGIIPFYHFNDVDSLDSILKQDNSSLLSRQQEWINNNFLENQFEKIFKKWNLI